MTVPTVGSAAVRASGWTLPERVVVVTLPMDRRTGLRSRLGARALLTSRPGNIIAVVPEPSSPTARQELGRALAGRNAVVGPERAWQAASDSLRLAVLARDLLQHGPDAEGPLGVAEHLTQLLLLSDRSMVEDLAAQRLAPLQQLRPAQRERLGATLLSWLTYHGHRAAMAAELAVHEQTVGYRVDQLRDVFGRTFNDPQARFEVELVLRALSRPKPS